MTLRPDSYEERLRRAREWDERRRRAAERYREKQRKEAGARSRLTRNGRLRRRPKPHDRFERQYHSRERVRWVRGLDCLVCFCGPCDNAHVRTGGMGMKASYVWIVPLCHSCHAELHTAGIRTFEGRYDLDLEDAARMVQEMWEARRG